MQQTISEKPLPRQEARETRAVVIGAGLGGISAAVALAADGYAVDLFEKNDRIGGKLNVLRTDGFSFDLGPSILTLPQIFRSLFALAGKRMEEYVALEEVRPHWRCFFEDGAHVDLTPDTRLMEVELARIGADGFYDYLEYSRSLYRTVERGFFRNGDDTLGELLGDYGLTALTGLDLLRNMDHGVARFVRNRKLREILDYFIKYVGSSPCDAPAFMNLLAYAQFGYGLWYVKGGMYSLAEGLGRLLRETGVTVHLDSEVVEITKEGRRVTGIVLKGGPAVPADVVVSNMEVIPAYRRLLGEDGEFLASYEQRFAPACSGYVLHLGVSRTWPRLRHHNFFFSQDPEKSFDEIFHRRVLPEDPTIYLVASTKTDPTQAPPGCENIKVLPHVPHLRDDRRFTKAEYEALRERVLDKLERMGLEGLRSHIVVEDRWTPEDIERRYYSNRGAIYGVLCDRAVNRGFKAPKKSERYDNLFFTGGSVNPGGGMPMVTLCGMQVRDRVRAATRR